jgi:hypothetical protein
MYNSLSLPLLQCTLMDGRCTYHNERLQGQSYSDFQIEDVNVLGFSSWGLDPRK